MASLEGSAGLAIVRPKQRTFLRAYQFYKPNIQYG
jgi:hypothetical protein